MNTSNSMKPPVSRRWKLVAGAFAVGLLMTGLTACKTTHQVSQTSKDFSGFLGDDQEYARLRKAGGVEANFVWVDRNAPWKSYTKVCILPVELWASDDPQSPFKNMSQRNKEVLVSLYQTAMAQTIHKDFEIVREPGSDTIVIHAAITEARQSKPVLNLVSSVYPASLVASYGKQMITGTGTGVGVVRVEAYFTDGGTGQRVAEGVDARAGTKAWRSKFDGTWGDVKEAFDFWSARLMMRLKSFQRGDFGSNE